MAGSLLALAVSIGAGYLSALIGLNAVLLGLVAAACVWLLAHRDWLAPAVMLACVAVPAGYPFDDAFRLDVGVARLSLVEVLMLVALVAAVGASKPTLRTEDGRLSPWVQLAIGGVLLSIVFGIVVGMAYGRTGRDIIHDVRPLVMYGAVLLPLLPRSRVHLRRLLTVLVLGMTFIAILQIASSFAPALRQFFLLADGSVGFRNGILYPLAMPLAIGFALHANRGRDVFAWTSCAVVITLGLALSQTRAVWAATGISAVVMALLLLARIERIRTRALAASVHLGVVLAAIVLVVALSGSSAVSSAVDGVLLRAKSLGNTEQDSSLSTRSANYRPANAMIRAHPLLGTGLGTTFVLRGRSGVVYSTSAAYVDNVPQTLLVKLGLLGTAPFILFWFLAGRGAWRLRRSGMPLYVACAASVPGMAVLLFASSYLAAGSQIAAFALLAGVFLRGKDVTIGLRN